MTSRARIARLAAEVHALASRYGAVTWDDAEGRWILVHQYPLPRGISKTYSAVLIDVPGRYPDVQPDGWYMDIDLTYSDRSRIAHLIVENDDYNKYRGLGYAWFCRHLKDWEPVGGIWGGDNLVSYFEWIGIQLLGNVG